VNVAKRDDRNDVVIKDDPLISRWHALIEKIDSIRLKESVPKPISIIHSIADSATGDSIYDKTDISFYLEQKGKWIDWKRYNANKKLHKYLQNNLKSGETLRPIFNMSDYRIN